MLIIDANSLMLPGASREAPGSLKIIHAQKENTTIRQPPQFDYKGQV
jgi:hypothetical protein